MNKYQQYHHAKFDSYHIYTVQEICNVKVFATLDNIQPAGLTLIITETHIFHVSQKMGHYLPGHQDFQTPPSFCATPHPSGCQKDTNLVKEISYTLLEKV